MIPLTDVVRHVRAREAADDPTAVIAEAMGVARDMADLARAGKHELARNAAAILGNLCLRLCAGRAVTAQDAARKQRFLAIMGRWAWPRDPVLGAVLDAARRAEEAIWGA